ncbi:MAG: PrsW family glutamic-type intramembrane protease [Anaerolineae bacterium]
MIREPAQEAKERPRRTGAGARPLLGLARVLALIGGLSAAAIGILVAGLSILSALFQGREPLVTMVTFSLSIVVVSVGLGLVVAWQALRAMQGHPSRSFRPPRAWPLVVLFGLAVAVGQLVLSLDLLPVVTFPPFHILAAALPPLFVLAVVGRALAGKASWREMILQVSSGALLSVPLAFVLEGVLIVGLVLLVFLGVALSPGGEEMIQRLSDLLQTAPALEDPEALAGAMRSPLVILAVTAVVAGAVPLIEEAVKTLGVPLLVYRRPGASQAVLWGLAGGAGFALVEGLLNTLGGLQGWALVVVVRLGATLLHCLTGALMGLAWYEGLRRRRGWRMLGLYAGSVAIHAFWNVLSVGVTFLSLGATGPEASSTAVLLSGLSLGLVAGLIVTALVLSLGLAGLIRYVRRHDPAAARAAPAMAVAGADAPLVLSPAAIEPGPEASEAWLDLDPDGSRPLLED